MKITKEELEQFLQLDGQADEINRQLTILGNKRRLLWVRIQKKYNLHSRKGSIKIDNKTREIIEEGE